MATITNTELGATGRYINLGSPAVLDDLGAQTVLAYCRPTGAGGNNLAYLYSKGSTGGSGPRFFINHNSGVPILTVGANSTDKSLFPTRPGTNNSAVYNSWGHYAYTWDGTLDSTNMLVYAGVGVNLANVSAADSSGNDGTTAVASDATYDAFLMNREGLGRDFIGDIAYIAIWDRVLTLAQLQNAQNNGPLEEPTGLVLLWANQDDLSTSELTATARSTYVAGATPPNTTLGGTVDTTAPVLTSPIGTPTGAATATLSFTTDEGNGTMYAVVTTSATPPSVAQVKAGQNNGGTAAVYAANQAISTTGATTFSATGLTAATTYYAYAVHADAAANDSLVSATASFITSAATVKGARVTLHNGSTPRASLTGIRAMWWNADLPSGAPAYETTAETTDASGVLELDLAAHTSLAVGAFGFLLLYKLDGTDYRDSLVFASKIAVVDIS